MVAVLSAVVGLVLGGALALASTWRRVERERREGVSNASQLAVRTSELATAREELARVRAEHDAKIANLEGTFENVSNRVLRATVEHFSESQEVGARERAATLEQTLRPLEELLNEYKRNLADFDKQHVGVLGDVKSRTDELLVEQRRSFDETRRLNLLLGRGDRRGRWGEVQLANVLEASGLVASLDYDLQVSTTNDAGRTQRPDCVVNLPQGAHVAIDAKFPFDAFDASLAATDEQERRDHEAKHARDLRAHVKTLSEKRYWDSLERAPEFVACFVPSDAAVSVALDADPELRDYAARARVLLVGPTNLLSLLWSVVMVVRQQKIVANAQEIYELAATLFERIRLVAEPLARVGKALDTQVREYNTMIGSFESRLIVTARKIQDLGGAPHAKELPEVAPVERFSQVLDPLKWGAADGSTWAAPAPVLDLEELTEGEKISEE